MEAHNQIGNDSQNVPVSPQIPHCLPGFRKFGKYCGLVVPKALPHPALYLPPIHFCLLAQILHFFGTNYFSSLVHFFQYRIRLEASLPPILQSQRLTKWKEYESADGLIKWVNQVHSKVTSVRFTVQ